MILQYECSGQAIWGARTGRTCDFLHVTKALRLMEWAGHKSPPVSKLTVVGPAPRIAP